MTKEQTKQQRYYFDITADQSYVVASTPDEAGKKIADMVAKSGIDWSFYEISEDEE